MRWVLPPHALAMLRNPIVGTSGRDPSQPPLPSTLRPQQLQASRRVRGGTPRCPDCSSFLHECTCEGTLGVAAPVPASSKWGQYAARHASPPPFEHPRSLKRPRSALSEEAGGIRKEPPSRRGDGGGSTTWSKGEGVPDRAVTVCDARQRGGGAKELSLIHI